MAAPRSAAGAQASSACARQSGSAASSPIGAATTFAATPRSGRPGAIRARSGAHPHIAAIVVATVRVTARTARGPRATTDAKGRSSRSRPAVDPAESANEMSHATSGSTAAATRSDQAKERVPDGRRASTLAAIPALSIPAARSADPPPPAKSA
jgi:hypothetical protein